MTYSPDLLKVADHCQHRSFITNRINKLLLYPRHEKQLFAAKNHILIDDLEKTIIEWREKGGIFGQIDIINDQHPNKVVIKSRQLGLSEISAAESLWFADRYSEEAVKVLYTFPKLWDFLG